MKKGKLFTALLLVAIGWVGNISIAAAAPSKNATNSHKKNKTVHKTSVSHQRQMSEKDITECTQLIEKAAQTVHKTSVSYQRQMSEKDITECTRLIEKVVQTDKMIQTEMIATATSNSKIAEHLKKPAVVQLFASDDPAAIAHLTGKSANLPIPSTVKPTTLPVQPPRPHPHIELFAPDPQVDLNHLEGRSANLTSLQKTAPPVNKSTTTQKPTQSSKKPTAPDAKAKKGDF